MALTIHDDNCGPQSTSKGVDLGPLPGFIGYALRRAQLMVFEDFIRTLETVDLRPAYFSALVVIDGNPGLNQSEVSAALGIQRTNFVTMVDHLQKRGLIERRPARNDRRSYALHLTEEGKALLARAHALQEGHEARITAKLSSSERQQLLRLLWKLVD